MAKGFFGRYFEDYTEERIPGSDGKMHTLRVYRGWWYVPRLTKAQRVLRAVVYLLLYGCGLALFVMGALQRSGCNSCWFVALPTGLVLFSLLIELIPLLGCALGKARQTVYQYRSGSKTCVLWAKITAGLMALTTALALLYFPLAHEPVGKTVAYFALACVCEAAVGLMEGRVIYDRQYNADA